MSTTNRKLDVGEDAVLGGDVEHLQRVGVPGEDDVVGPERLRGLGLGLAGGQRDRLGAQRVREPDREVPEPADADDAHRRARAGTEAAQRRPGRDPAQSRGALAAVVARGLSPGTAASATG
jgi:hypothetical protein